MWKVWNRMRNICVIVSTFNGEKYIEEQINSLINQEGVDVDIYVRDDGSSDNTINILEKYSCIDLEVGQNMGYTKSFMKKLYEVPENYEYYAFCSSGLLSS